MFRYEDKLSTDTNAKLFSAIDRGRPILLKNGGRFTTDDLDDFLGIFNQIYESNSREIIGDDLIYSNFSYMLLRAYENKEIQNYLKEIRTEDEEYFAGFDELAESQIDYTEVISEDK